MYEETRSKRVMAVMDFSDDERTEKRRRRKDMEGVYGWRGIQTRRRLTMHHVIITRHLPQHIYVYEFFGQLSFLL